MIDVITLQEKNFLKTIKCFIKPQTATVKKKVKDIKTWKSLKPCDSQPLNGVSLIKCAWDCSWFVTFQDTQTIADWVACPDITFVGDLSNLKDNLHIKLLKERRRRKLIINCYCIGTFNKNNKSDSHTNPLYVLIRSI